MCSTVIWTSPELLSAVASNILGFSYDPRGTCVGWVYLMQDLAVGVALLCLACRTSLPQHTACTLPGHSEVESAILYAHLWVLQDCTEQR